MTDDFNAGGAGTPPHGRSRTSGLRGYGSAPVLAGGILGGVLLIALVLGSFSAANAMSAENARTPVPSASDSSTPSPDSTAPPIPGSGNAVPGTEDPVAPPDRVSDQTGEPAVEDTIYSIQEGDTLTDISAQFGISVDYLADYNAVRDVNVISEGAALRVPFVYIPPAGSGPAE